MALNKIFQIFPELETERLILRRIQMADSAALYGILSDELVTQFYDDATFTDISQAREQIESWENGYQQRRCIRWAITHKDDPTMIGSCGFYSIHPWHLRASIGYELRRSFWRMGMMSEALRAMLSLGFNEMALNRIDAVVLPENIASIRLLEKLGFSMEGILRGYENWDGKGFVDLGMYSLTRKEWELGSLELKNE